MGVRPTPAAGDWHRVCSNGGVAQRAAVVRRRPRPGPTEGTHMPLLSQPAFGPRTAIVYITIILAVATLVFNRRNFK